MTVERLSKVNKLVLSSNYEFQQKTIRAPVSFPINKTENRKLIPTYHFNKSICSLAKYFPSGLVNLHFTEQEA